MRRVVYAISAVKVAVDVREEIRTFVESISVKSSCAYCTSASKVLNNITLCTAHPPKILPVHGNTSVRYSQGVWPVVQPTDSCSLQEISRSSFSEHIQKEVLEKFGERVACILRPSADRTFYEHESKKEPEVVREKIVKLAGVTKARVDEENTLWIDDIVVVFDAYLEMDSRSETPEQKASRELAERDQNPKTLEEYLDKAVRYYRLAGVVLEQADIDKLTEKWNAQQETKRLHEIVDPFGKGD